MSLGIYKNIYFLGIGGIGMSAIARWFRAQNFVVGGYDKTATELTAHLIEEGMDLHYDNQVGRIPTVFYKKEETLVVLTPAIPKDNIELKYFQDNGYTIMKRSQVLGLLTKDMFTIAVAGTHGKTTTSSMTAHVLKSCGVKVNAFLGGITVNYESNLLIGDKNGVVVVEADEFDRSFLTLYPDIAVITSTDADHLDIYGEAEEVKKTFTLFASQIKEGGKLFLRDGLEVGKPKGVKIRNYAYNGKNIKAENLRVENGNFVFDYVSENHKIENISMLIPGFHNTENALAAISIALEVGLDPSKVKAGIESFKGVKRRFQYILRSDKVVYIDDYAHHPTEIEAFLKSVKKLYEGKKVTCIFQPHLFSRTRDFMDGFAESLSLADKLILLDIYPARELPIEGVTSKVVLDKVTIKDKVICGKADLMSLLEKEETDILVTVGAGDIDTFVKPIREMLIKKYSLVL
jgi:UDP-N-acetylmuramate--alanine ligase